MAHSLSPSHCLCRIVDSLLPLSSAVALFIQMRNLFVADVLDHLALGQLVELILMDVEVAELEVEARAGNNGEDSNDGIVPDQEGVGGETGEGLADGGGKGSHEEGNGLDHAAHVLGGLGVGVLERGDGGKDLGEGDEDVGARLGPDADVDLGAADHLAGDGVGPLLGGAVAADGALVDVVLDDGGPDHGGGADEEAGRDLTDGGEAEACLADGGVDDEVVEGNEDEEGKRVEVGEDVVGDAVALEDGSLGDEVVVDCVVSKSIQDSSVACPRIERSEVINLLWL